jgi:hypothetical protein
MILLTRKIPDRWRVLETCRYWIELREAYHVITPRTHRSNMRSVIRFARLSQEKSK